MKKIGDIVSCRVATIDKRFKFVPTDYEGESTVKFFEIIGINYYDLDKTVIGYMVLIPSTDGWRGWGVSKFHVGYMKVPAKFLNKSFYEISSDKII